MKDKLLNIRATLTEPRKIKFIDDVLEAMAEKDRVIEANHRYIRMMQQVNLKTIKESQDIKLRLEGCCLRWGIPGWEIERWLRMKDPVQEVKFWIEFEKDMSDKIIKVQSGPVVKPRIAKRPLLDWSKGLPTIPYKPLFLLKEIVGKLNVKL